MTAALQYETAKRGAEQIHLVHHTSYILHPTEHYAARMYVHTWWELVMFHILTLPLDPPDTMRHGERESLSAIARAVTWWERSGE